MLYDTIKNTYIFRAKLVIYYEYDNFKKAFVTSLPVMAGYLFLGTGFGILLQSKGYNFVWAILMSFTIYAGSMQYIAVDLLSSVTDTYGKCPPSFLWHINVRKV